MVLGHVLEHQIQRLASLDHVFYLYIQTLSDADHPYMCLPTSWHTLYDLKEGWHA